MAAGIEDRDLVDRVEQDRDRGEAEHDEGHGEDVEHYELHLGRADALTEVLRCPADHQACDEHREDREHEDPVEPRADASGETSPNIMLTSGTAPPSGVKLSCARTAPVEVPVVEAAKMPDTAEPNRASLPSMLEPRRRGPRLAGCPATRSGPRARRSPPRGSPSPRRPPTPGACPAPAGRRRMPAKGDKKRAKISSRFVNGVGFESGCAEFALSVRRR